jgi:multisubunit Na+/H+ antiporter MnhG subunit
MTDVRRRSQPLRADDGGDEEVVSPPTAPSAAGDAVTFDIGHVDTAHQRTDQDRQAFTDAVRALRTSAGALNLSEHTLMIIGGVVAPLGLLLVLLGWVGASRTPNLFEQIPYLISGGLFGLGLVFLGAFFYFAHWMTELVKEHRAQSGALLAAISELRDEITRQTEPAVEAPVGDVLLVATARGSMAHRPDCVVVADKDDVRAIGADEGLAPCKLCDPYGAGPSVN